MITWLKVGEINSPLQVVLRKATVTQLYSKRPGLISELSGKTKYNVVYLSIFHWKKRFQNK